MLVGVITFTCCSILTFNFNFIKILINVIHIDSITDMTAWLCISFISLFLCLLALADRRRAICETHHSIIQVLVTRIILTIIFTAVLFWAEFLMLVRMFRYNRTVFLFLAFFRILRDAIFFCFTLVVIVEILLFLLALAWWGSTRTLLTLEISHYFLKFFRLNWLILKLIFGG